MSLIWDIICKLFRTGLNNNNIQENTDTIRNNILTHTRSDKTVNIEMFVHHPSLQSTASIYVFA